MKTTKKTTNPTTKTRNWPASEEFSTTATQVEAALEAALKTVRALRFDDTTQKGYRTAADVSALGDLLGYLQLFCEAATKLDGGRLAKQVLGTWG